MWTLKWGIYAEGERMGEVEGEVWRGCKYMGCVMGVGMA